MNDTQTEVDGCTCGWAPQEYCDVHHAEAIIVPVKVRSHNERDWDRIRHGLRIA